VLETEPRRAEAPARTNPIDRMLLHALDAWVRDAAVLTDRERLGCLLRAAANAVALRVVGEEFAVFPNGAVTGVLLLAQSHLSIHTWPEHALANVDLLTYGDVDGEAVLGVLCDGLGAVRVELTRIVRTIG
jgi:S-adenosylmethionine decarboxylase